MATKDPHIALIDAHEQLMQVKRSVHQALRLLGQKRARGEPLTEDDRLMMRAIHATAIDRTRRIQDKLAEELESHKHVV